MNIALYTFSYVFHLYWIAWRIGTLKNVDQYARAIHKFLAAMLDNVDLEAKGHVQVRY